MLLLLTLSSSDSSLYLGEAKYWDDRYSLEDSAFDWLFSYADVKGLINQLIPEKSTPSLLVVQ